MAKFEIKCEQSLGWSHYGEETAKGKSFVELTDEDATGTEVSVIFTNITRANYLMQIAEFLKLNKKRG